VLAFVDSEKWEMESGLGGSLIKVMQSNGCKRIIGSGCQIGGSRMPIAVVIAVNLLFFLLQRKEGGRAG
jgi:hypothetical protein